MKIVDCTEIKICNNNFLKMSVFLENTIKPNEIRELSKGKVLIYNEKLSLPYFKIIDKEYIIRGSTESNQLTLDFNSIDKNECVRIRNVYCNLCIGQTNCKKNS